MKLNLRGKTVMGIVILSMVLAVTVMNFSYRTYKNAFDTHYGTLATNLAKTVAVMVEPDEVEELKDEVMGVYLENPAPEFATEEELETYLTQYDTFKDTKYQDIHHILEKVKRKNGIFSLYIAYMDPETMTSVYLVDSDNSDNTYPMGAWEAISPDNYECMKSPEKEFAPAITNTDELGWFATSSAPIIAEDGEVVGHVFLDVSMNHVVESQNKYLAVLLVLIVVAIILIILLATYVVNKVVVKPINMLAYATSSYMKDRENAEKGDISEITKLQIKTGDEMEHLSYSIKQMEKDINTYIENITTITAEKERISAELNVATHIQAAMLPSIFPPFPERDEFEVYATMTPAKEVGGDFYDFFLVDDNHFATVIADVSGKGVPAALFMVIAKTLIKNTALQGCSPKEILEKVNNQLLENNETGMFVTVWIGILELSSGKMICANAGHEYPAIKKANGEFKLLKDKHGFVLAGYENMKYHEYEIQMEMNDVIYVYTDGVAEAMNEADQQFGVENMLLSLNENKEKSLEEVLHQVKHEVDLFVGDAPQFDDITMLSLKFKGRES